MIGGSLCSGGGGLDLGLEQALGIQWAWFAEPDPAAATVLETHYPGVPNHGDLFRDWSTVERVDLLAAGFPCPDYSLAGRRAGIEGDHGQVWFGVADALRALRPRYVVLENVPGIRTAAGLRLDAGESALGVVCADLAALGYRWAYDCLRAADVGAPHGRDRWFLIARLPSADPVGAGVDADGGVPRGVPDAPGSGRSASPAVAAGPEVDDAADALEDGPGAPPEGRGGSAADAGRVAGSEAGELDGGSGAGGVEGARGDAREAIGRTAGRDRGRGKAAADAGRLGQPGPDGRRDEGRGAEPSGGRPAAADADDAGRREHGGAVAAGEELATAEPHCGGRGRGETTTDPDGADGRRRREAGRVPSTTGTGDSPSAGGRETPSDADGGGLGGERLTESGGVEGAFGGEPDGRDPDRRLEDAAAAADAAGCGRGRGQAGEGRDVAVGTPTVGPEGDSAARDGDLDARDDLRNAVHAGGRAADPVADAGRERGEPGRGRRTAGGADARREPQKRDGDGHDGPAEPGQDEEAAADPDELRRGEGEQGAEVRDGRSDALERGERGNVEWGVYGPAVDRWERILGRPAPAPTDEQGRLAPAFVEWMLGFPAGWVSDVDIPRTAQLRILGNSVQVQVSEQVGLWLGRLTLTGVL